MDSWNYIDIDSSKTKSRITDDDLSSISIFSDICKVKKQTKNKTNLQILLNFPNSKQLTY